MRTHVKLGAAGAALILLAAGAAWGQTFSYFEDFNDYSHMPAGVVGPEPIGWVAWDNGYWSAAESKPRVFGGDYGGWNTTPTSDDDYYHSYWGTLGSVDYTVPWSGGARYNLIHSGWDPNYRNADVWYSGVPQTGYTAKHTGTYPMDLQNNSLRAEFDVIIRSGVRATIGNGGSASGGVFAVLPASNVNDITLGGPNGGWLGWGTVGGMPGFSVELDIQPSGGDPAAGTDGNHIGINVMDQWNNRAGLSSVPSVATNVDLGVTLPFNMELVGDNNQPLHVTVYYNDPAHSPDGNLGWVSVYLKVRAADKAAGDPPVPADLAAPYSFGEGAGDPPDGILVAQAQLGAFPGTAVFGFCASNEWYKTNQIFQVDNVNVQTNPATGTYGTPTWAPTVNPDPQSHAVALDPAGLAASMPSATDTTKGWTCYTYPGVNDYWNPGEGLLAWFKGGIQTCDAAGLGGPGVVLREINWQEMADGQDDNLNGTVEWPGMPPYDNQWYTVLAKGYVYFPAAGTFSMCLNVDDGGEVVIGNQCVATVSGGWGNGIDSGYIFNLTVGTPGVYPIQVIGYEGYGGSNCEFYRRTQNPLETFASIGASDHGFADQPVVYTTLDGVQPATNLAATGSTAALVYAVASTTLDTSSRMGDVSTAGASGLINTKVVYAPNRWYWDGANGNVLPDFTYSIDAWQRTNEENWLNFLQNQVSGTGAVSKVNFMGGSYYWTECMRGSDFPGWNANARAMGARFQGYIVFPAAGDYYLGMVSEDGSYLWIGQQLIVETMSFDEPGKMMHVNVPQAGVYPVRVDVISSTDNRILTLYEVVPGHSKVAINDPLSRIKLAQTCTAGNYTWPTRFNAIPEIPPANDPANHMVAAAGQGGTPGWNGQVTRFTDNAFDIWHQALPALWNKGADPMAFAYPTPHAVTAMDPTMVQATAVLPDINLWTQFDVNDFVCCEGMPAGFLPRFVSTMRYFGDFFSNISTDSGVNEDRFSATFTGYVEFTQAGDYMFNAGTSDGMTIWIAGQVVTCKSWTNGWPYDSNPAYFHVSAPGIYDIRVDYFQQYWNSLVNVYMWLPNGTPVLINSLDAQAAGVTVYATLATGINPATTAYADPTVVHASSKVAELNASGIPGYHVMVVDANQNGSPVPWRGYGAELLFDIFRADQLLAKVLDGATVHPSTLGTLAADYVTGATQPLFICPDCGAPGGAPWPGPTSQRDHVAARVNGYMALKAGGHFLHVCTDDGARLVIGGQLTAPETVTIAGGSDTVQAYRHMVGGQEVGAMKVGNVGTRYQDVCYVYVEEDGMYPFEITYNNGWGGTALILREQMNPMLNDGNAMEADFQYPNWGTMSSNPSDTFTKVFVTLCNVPWADTDGDKDVDQADFGVFQECFTGSITGPLTVQCRCLDQAGAAGSISADDFTAFMNCWTGPAIQWVSNPLCP